VISKIRVRRLSGFLQNVIIVYSGVSNLELRYHADNDQDFVLMFDSLPRVAVDAAEGDSGLKRYGKTE